MPVKVGINGFGRIGRNVYRAAQGRRDLEIVAVNDITDPPTLAHLLKYDSILGTYAGAVRADGDALDIDGTRVKVFAERDPGNLPWKDMGIEIVIESTGLFTDATKAKAHIDKGGAKKVIISAPAKNEDITIVLGVNGERYDPRQHHVVSNASCTTNCLAPVAKVIHDSFGIEAGLMTTIHSYTSDQRLLDAPHKDLRRARAAALSLIPTSTGAATAMALVMPELKGKFHGISLRVPTPDVSLVDLAVTTRDAVSAETINEALREAAASDLKGILAVTEEELVSSDFKGNPYSAIVDAPLDKVLSTILDKIGWSRAFDRGSGTLRRGRGFGVAIKAITSPTTSVAIINVAADGSVTLYCGTVDMGQGSDTALAQMVGEALNVAAESVKIVHPDTDATPYDMGTLGSRSLFHMGHAIQRAAEEVRNKIAALRRDVGEVEGSNTPISELFRKRYGMQAGNIIGSGAFRPDYVSPSRETGQSTAVTPFWIVAGAGAEVEVDTETGHINIAKLVNVVDAGKAINPAIVATQISGGAVMQLGFTLFEKMHLDAGQVVNASLADYKIPGFRDLPERMENLHVEHEQSNGPFGAKGVGESSMFCVSPAIANAIEDAAGIRLTRLPLDPETVYRALRAKAGKPLEDA